MWEIEKNNMDIKDKEQHFSLLEEDWKFYKRFWNRNKMRRCYNCNAFLGSEPKTYMFDHILPKEKYPEFRHNMNNICYLCLTCHDTKTRGFLSAKLKKLVEKTKRKLGVKD